jgi:hypothetical protein
MGAGPACERADGASVDVAGASTSLESVSTRTAPASRNVVGSGPLI